MNITKHFTLEEMLRTSTHLNNSITSDSDIQSNIIRLVEVLLEPLRVKLGKPIKVNSGYRSPAVNAAIGGAPDSAHMKGLAADIVVEGMTPIELSEFIRDSGLPYDTVICEPTWVHLQINAKDVAPRKRLMTAKRIDGKMTYYNGLIA